MGGRDPSEQVVAIVGMRSVAPGGLPWSTSGHSRASLNLFIGKPLVVELLIGSVLAKGEQRIVHLL